MILDEIIAHKRVELKRRMDEVPLDHLQRRIKNCPPAKSLKGNIGRKAGQRLKVIAEIKRRSPSKGLMAADFKPEDIAAGYENAGAAAISVLTDEKYFGGTVDHLYRVRAVSRLPVLRKDFVIHPYQVYEARAYGADAVLLIVRVLKQRELEELYRLAADLGMQAVVEVHGEEDMERALDAGVEIIGINNRDLNDFTVDLAVTERLSKLLPPRVVSVSESGVKTAKDVAFLEGLGIDAALVGEALMCSTDPGMSLKKLLEGGNGDGPGENMRHTVL